jgi:hypothetical protein
MEYLWNDTNRENQIFWRKPLPVALHSLTHSLPGATTHAGSWPTQVIASNQLCPWPCSSSLLLRYSLFALKSMRNTNYTKWEEIKCVCVFVVQKVITELLTFRDTSWKWSLSFMQSSESPCDKSPHWSWRPSAHSSFERNCTCRSGKSNLGCLAHS